MPDESYLDINYYNRDPRLDAPIGFNIKPKQPPPPLPPKPPGMAAKKPVWPPPKKRVKKFVDRAAYKGMWHCYLQNYQEVLADRVYRSAAPCYEIHKHDAVQVVRPETIAYLKHHRFRNIISLNECGVNTESRKQLTAVGIIHKHLPVRDFKPLSMKQMQKGVAIANSGKTLIHCGYGEGRTGTLVSAWVLHYTHTRNPNFFGKYTVKELFALTAGFGVEKDPQYIAIAHYFKKINPGWNPKDWDTLLSFHKQTAAAAAAAIAKAKFAANQTAPQLTAGSGDSLPYGPSFVPPGPSGGSNN